MPGMCSLVRRGGAGRHEAPEEGARAMCWVVPSLQSRLRKMRHLFYLWSFSAADAKCVWISGEHFHLSLRGAGSSLTKSARTNFLELSFLLVCETEVIKVTGIIHLLNTALFTGESLLFNSFMCLRGNFIRGNLSSGEICHWQRLPRGWSGCKMYRKGTHMCLSRYSVHCTITMPSKGECSHTVPQSPSLPTTN